MAEEISGKLVTGVDLIRNTKVTLKRTLDLSYCASLREGPSGGGVPSAPRREARGEGGFRAHHGGRGGSLASQAKCQVHRMFAVAVISRQKATFKIRDDIARRSSYLRSITWTRISSFVRCRSRAQMAEHKCMLTLAK